MEILIGWIIFSIVAAIIASSKGRSGGGYFFLSMILSPLIGIILAAALPSLKNQAAGGVGAPTPETHVKCPDCRELVLADARKCKHCGCTLVPESDMTEEQLIAHYGLRKEGRIYHVGDVRFDDLNKAIAAARKAS